MVITAETSVRDIVTAFPTTIPVLERLGVDYCCHGQHTLAAACEKRDLKLAPVIEELEQIQRQPAKPTESYWLHAPFKELIDHIVQVHHAYTREHLKLIDELMDKVERRHGAEHPEVFQIGKTVAVFGSELRHHAECEETNLFPYVAALGTGQQPDATNAAQLASCASDPRPELPAPAKGNLNMPITRMMTDHDQTAEELGTLRKLTNNYVPPPEACPTWRALYRCLEELEADLHQHIHLENNILFPRALAEAAKEEKHKKTVGAA